MSGVIR